jgi:tetratricopeptide (TPR) repeat protein
MPVRTALLVEYFSRVPQRFVRGSGTIALGQYEAEGPESSRPSRRNAPDRTRTAAALDAFRKKVLERYTEATLVRLLLTGEVRARRAAAFTLGLLGSMEQANGPLAVCLHDDDREVQRLAADALWALWFGADTPAHCRELRRLVRLGSREETLAGLNRLIQKAPHFAEAYNQRAIVQFRLRSFECSAADCERVLELNPHHFGAQAGLGQCYLHLRRHRAALRAFRAALRINPRLDGVAAAIRDLEEALGEEGR